MDKNSGHPGTSVEGDDSVAAPAPEATAAPVPQTPNHTMSHRALVISVTLSVCLHAAAIAALSGLRLRASGPPILADLVVLTSPGPTSEPGHTEPAHLARAAVTPLASSRRSLAAVPPTRPPPEPPPPQTVAAPVPEVTPPPAEATASKAEWPSVRVPSFQIPRLEAAPGSQVATNSEGPSSPTIVPVQGALTSTVSTFANPGSVSRAWGGKSAALTGTDVGTPTRAFSAPRLEHEVKPRYPEVARRAGVEGTTLVKAYVRPDGTVGVAEIGRSSGNSALDSAALDAIRTAAFVPAARDEFPVAVWIQVPVQFKLEQ